MPTRQFGRAGALAIASLLALTGTALADSVAADGDQLTAGVQTYVDLGAVAPGATIARDVTMTLFCGGTRHVDPGQIVTLSQVATTVPSEGGSISATDTTVGPVPASWADDTAGPSGCSGPMQVDSSTPSHVTLVAPTTPGLDYTFVIEYGRTFAPAGVADSLSISGFTSVAFVIDVVDGAPDDTAPPTFTDIPADVEVMTSDSSGASVDYPWPVATDDSGAAPVVDCVPAPGAWFNVGSTIVTCTATDAAGNAAIETFRVSVHLGGVSWDSPVRVPRTTINHGRSLPIKVRAWMDGAPAGGPARFELSPCGDASSLAMTIQAGRQAGPGRWMAILETGNLTGSCYLVELVVGEHRMGSFELDLVGVPTAARCAAHRGAHRAR